MASQWIANFRRRPGKSALVPLVLLSSGVLASVCADTEYYRPLTDGDGIRYIGGGRYIMYAHMIPGSPTVSVGDVVTTGYVLGKLGDSGNASQPHLHFQVMDRPSSLGAHGLPYVFDHMYREATYPGTVATELNDIGAGIPLLLNFSTAAYFHDTMPLTLDVVDFK
jgi:murein DD-endopeptidase MepM/ murein hydrolase activator NlpD